MRVEVIAVTALSTEAMQSVAKKIRGESATAASDAAGLSPYQPAGFVTILDGALHTSYTESDAARHYSVVVAITDAPITLAAALRRWTPLAVTEALGIIYASGTLIDWYNALRVDTGKLGLFGRDAWDALNKHRISI